MKVSKEELSFSKHIQNNCPRFQQDAQKRVLTSSSTVAGPLERSLRVPLPVPILFSLAGLAPFDLGSSISGSQKRNYIKFVFLQVAQIHWWTKAFRFQLQTSYGFYKLFVARKGNQQRCNLAFLNTHSDVPLIRETVV